MKYKNNARHKMLLQINSDTIREIVPGEVFETTAVLSYAFLEEVKEKKEVPAPAPAQQLDFQISPPTVEFAKKTKTTKTPKKKKIPPIVEEKLDGSNNTEIK